MFNLFKVEMKVHLRFFIAIFAAFLITGIAKSEDQKMKTVYDFNAKTIDGEEISLDKYKGNVLLIVNVAGNCGFTKQYAGLQKLYEAYKDQGFYVLGFPCNQFAGQEPGTEEEIKEFCSTTYGVTFPMFSKIDVNGDDAHPLYKFLKSEKKGAAGESIKWNFTKFLIDREGNVVDRFATTTTPGKISPKIAELLGE